jgi:hypothetical protein
MSSREDDYFEDKNDYKYDPNEYDPNEYDPNEYDPNEYDPNEYEDENDNDNYDELMNVSNQSKTDNKLSDILYGLMNVVKLQKKKEIGFTYDYTIVYKNDWLNIVKDFNSKIVGNDYKFLIDETGIVCYVTNDNLLK